MDDRLFVEAVPTTSGPPAILLGFSMGPLSLPSSEIVAKLSSEIIQGHEIVSDFHRRGTLEPASYWAANLRTASPLEM